MTLPRNPYPKGATVLEFVHPIKKFIVAAVGLAVAFGLLDEGTAQDVVGVLTAAAVYLVPND